MTPLPRAARRPGKHNPGGGGDGPLKGPEGGAAEADLHKREARMRGEFMGRDLKMKTGTGSAGPGGGKG